MTFRRADLVLEQVPAPAGAAPFAIATAAVWQTAAGVAGYRTFAAIPGIVADDTVNIVATDNAGNVELGPGTWTSGSLARAPVVSSNGNAACNFVGTVTVCCVLTAEEFAPASGATSARPVGVPDWTQWGDDTLGQPIWALAASSTGWINAAGAPV